jgi:hypothetical protein
MLEFVYEEAALMQAYLPHWHFGFRREWIYFFGSSSLYLEIFKFLVEYRFKFPKIMPRPKLEITATFRRV